MILLTKNPFAYTVWLMEETNITAFAKINIGLKIFDRRKSGYHDIESLFQNVDIADTLRIRPNNVGKIVIEGDIGCAPEQSTIYHAAKHFCMEFEDKSPITGVTIKVEKGIPSGAGLGGAGADAAATLFGMNELFEKRLSRAELARIGSRVASDVAFFLYGGAAIVRGRGEYVFPIEPRTDFGLVILQPTWASSTPEAYAALDNYRAIRGIEHACTSEDAAGYSINLPNEQLEKIYRSPIQKWGFENDFLPVLAEKKKQYSEMLSLLQEAGAAYVNLTGSGSCVFGVFDNAEAAQKASCTCSSLLFGEGDRAQSFAAHIIAAKPLARSMIVSYIQDCNEDTRSDKERPCYGSY